MDSTDSLPTSASVPREILKPIIDGADTDRVQQDVDHESVRAAAEAIHNADILLLASGAGLSADSGLATFATLTAKMGSKLGEGITYDYAAGSTTMAENPELFFAFWFHALRAYSDTEPHAGYDVLRSWREKVEQRTADRMAKEPGLPEISKPVFVLTSNVDGWSARKGVAMPGGFAQIHGSINKWQCGGVPNQKRVAGKLFPTWLKDRCCDDLFDPPDAAGIDFDAVPIRYTLPAPRCPRCAEGWLRPQIYLFGDGSRFNNNEDVTGDQAFQDWKAEVLQALSRCSKLKLVVVEIGCGLRVPNIRKRCEEIVAKSPCGQCEFIRINPEVSDTEFEARPTIFVKDTALSALQRINANC